MILESLPIQNMNSNITGVITESTPEITSQILTSIWDKISPLIQILGGLLVIYIIYILIKSITSHLLKKRIKRIDKNVQNLNKKVDEILKIIDKKEKHKKK
ncbi:MAG: hypothetical protein ABH840_04075 [Nanoarchaeota archaeon]